MAAFVVSSSKWKLPEDKPAIYLMADLAVPSAEKRLSKLVLLCLLSKEVKTLLDVKRLENHTYVTTTAFSLNPVSMKYRGIFTLHSRKQQKYANGYALNYYAHLGEASLEQQLQRWYKKYKK